MHNGFTLLEVLLTVVILAGTIIAITQAFSTATFAAAEAENIELALGVAQAKLEKIHGTTGGIADEPPHRVSAEGFVGGAYSNQDYLIQVATDNNDPERVDVTISWSTKGGNPQITLTTIMAN